MKIKKIISLLAAVSVLSASIVSVSALTIDKDGMINDIPANSEILTRNPELSVAATQLTTADEVKAAGANTRFLKTTGNVDNYDVYKLEVTVSNLGELTNGYDPKYEYAYIGVTNLELGFATTDIVGSYVTGSQLGGTASAGQGTQTGKEKYFYVNYASSSTDNPYPAFDKENGETAEYIENGSMTINALVSIAKGTTVTISEFAPVVVYQASGGVENVKVTNITAPKSLVLGKADVPAPVITVKPDTAEMILGNTVELVASNDQDAKLTYTYKSSSDKIATVDVNGVVKAVGEGSATITVSAEGAKPAECTINVRKATVGEEFTSTDFGKKIKFLESKLVNIGNHNQFIYITKGDETRKSDKTIGEILGGEWVEGSTVEGTIAIGVISESPLDAFSFEIK